MSRVILIVMSITISDEVLALAAGRGDRTAYAALLERHYDRIFTLCWRLTGQRAEAEDLTQDICATLPAKLRGWRNEARLTTWLYRVAVNAAHDRRRRLASHTKAVTGWADWEAGRRADIAAEADDQDWLRGAMTSLSDELRDTVTLVLGEGLSQAEAAEVLGIPEGTVAWRMSEVKKKLRAVAQEETR